MAYASDTRVPVEKTRGELEALLIKHKCDGFAIAYDRTSRRASIEFKMRRRRLRFELVIPDDRYAQQVRSRWRALLLVVKAKLESVEAGIESFDEAFLAHVVMPDGRRFGEITIPQLEYQGK